MRPTPAQRMPRFARLAVATAAFALFLLAAGGLAGLYYGYESIPKAWLKAIQKREQVEALISALH